MSRPEVQVLADLDRDHVLHPISEFRVHEKKGPRIVTGGEGIWLELADGRRVIDGFSGLFNINVGHGRREIADAVSRQMQEIAYYPAFWDFSTEPAIRLAERIAGLLPADRELRRFLFTSGGSDPNETGAGRSGRRSSPGATPTTASPGPRAPRPGCPPTTSSPPRTRPTSRRRRPTASAASSARRPIAAPCSARRPPWRPSSARGRRASRPSSSSR